MIKPLIITLCALSFNFFYPSSLHKIHSFVHQTSEVRSITVLATAYGPRCDVNGLVAWSHDPWPSHRPFEGTVAVSRDMWVPYGTYLYWQGHNYIVRDLMGPGRSHRIDFWMKSCERARQFGVRKIQVEVLQ